MATLTHIEKMIICDNCGTGLTDYSAKPISHIRKEYKLKKINGQDLCKTCQSQKQ